jgi:hypothetical protein
MLAPFNIIPVNMIIAPSPKTNFVFMLINSNAIVNNKFDTTVSMSY